MKTIEAGDVIIKRLEMSNRTTSGFVIPKDQIIGFDIWEDMTKPTMYAEFMFVDNVGLLESFPIIGEEVIKVEMRSPGLIQSAVYTFRSFEIARVTKDVNGKGVNFVLRCVSEEHLHNGSSLITQSYRDVISNIVPSILSKYLKTKKPIIVDETRGINSLAIPKLTPLQTIDMCRQRAVSRSYSSSAYVFFENQSGFNFKTVEGLLKESKSAIGSRVFNAQQNVTATPQAQANAFRTILEYTKITSSDSNMKAQSGVFKSETKTFDIATKKFETSSFNLKDKYNQFTTPSSGKPQIPNSDDFINTFASGTPKQFFVPRNTSGGDTFIDAAMAARVSYTLLLNSDITRVMVHGDTGMKVGDVVTLNLPEASGMTNRKGPEKVSAGNYLVTRLRHMITQSTKSKHRIVFDCVKMGL